MGDSAGATAELHWRHQQSSCKYNMCGQHWRQGWDHGKRRRSEKKKKINCTSGRGRKERTNSQDQLDEDSSDGKCEGLSWFCSQSITAVSVLIQSTAVMNKRKSYEVP